MSENGVTGLSKYITLSVVGAGLQTAGAICLIAAALGIGNKINQQIKKTIIKELSKQIPET